MKMQNFTKTLFFSFATAALLSAVGCSSDDEVLKENSKIEIKNFDVNVAEGDSVLNFFAANNWSATLSTTSWIEIDPMTKVGAKGESKIILKWKASTSIKERIADLTIAVEGETPVVIRITQLPNAPYIAIDKTESLLQVNRKAANGRGLFCDTLTVKSNIKWTVKDYAGWIDYEVLGATEPQEGVVTNIQVVLKGKPAAFDAAEMNGNVVIGKLADAANDNTVAVKAISELAVVEMDSDLPLTKIVLERSAALGNNFGGRMIVTANTSWSLQNMPSWIVASAVDNSSEYASSLISRKMIAFVVNENDLDTESKSHTILVKDSKTGVSSEVELFFPGTGDNFFESKLAFTPDFKFDPSNYTPDWSPVDGAVLSWDFNMISAQDFTSLDNAPFKFYFVHLQNGMWPVRMEAEWAWVEMAQAQTRAALNKKPMTLVVNDRNMRYDPLNDQYQERSAYMIVAPATVSFDDLFEGDSDDLKEEYMSVATMVIQKGITLPAPDTNMPEYFRFGGEGGVSVTYEVSNFDKVSTFVDGESLLPDFWAGVEFDRDDMGVPMNIRIKTLPNETGKERTCKLVFMNFIEATQTEEHVITVTVTQDAK